MDFKYKIRSDRRIIALKEGPWGKKGTLGGFIFDDAFLSHQGDCWLYNNSSIHNKSRVTQDATLHDNASAHHHASIKQKAAMYEYSKAEGGSTVGAKAAISDNVIVRDRARIGGTALVLGSVVVSEFANINRNAVVLGNTTIQDTAYIGAHALITSNKDYKEFQVIPNNPFRVTCYKDFAGSFQVFNGCRAVPVDAEDFIEQIYDIEPYLGPKEIYEDLSKAVQEWVSIQMYS